MKTQTRTVEELPLDKITIGLSQVRLRDVDQEISELADSIEKMGLLEPIVVSETDDGRYEVVTGQRRFLAHQKLGRDRIMAVILKGRIEPDIAKAISLTENMVRRDLSEKDYIDACTDLYRRYGSIKAVVEELGLPHYKVSRYVKYDQLSPKLKELVDNGQVELKTALRAVKAATDETGSVNEESAVVFVEEMKGMSDLQKSNLEKAAIDNPGASVDEIIEAGRKPPRQTKITVIVAENLNEGLRKFATDEGTNEADAAVTLIETGLTNRGYLDEEDV